MSCASTNHDIESVTATLLDNIGFEGSLSKATLVRDAGRRWLALSPVSASQGGASHSLNVDFVEDLVERAATYVDQNSTGGAVTNLGVREDFRG